MAECDAHQGGHLTGELSDWVALNRLIGLSPILVRRALETHRDPAQIAYRMTSAQFRRLSARGRNIQADALRDARRNLHRSAKEETRQCLRLGIRLLPLGHPDYPADLAQLSDAPPLLYVQGRSFNSAPPVPCRVAIIGSRRATPYGRRVAEAMAEDLSALGIPVVSGGAAGIDAAAHRGSLAADGPTLAVMGAGLSRPYPANHASLFEKISQRGACISEFPLEYPPKSENFPRRNRIISALATAVLVVEAGIRSGTQITAGYALDQGKEVLAVPGPIGSLQSAGCHSLIQQGAKLVHGLQDILDELPLSHLSEGRSDGRLGGRSAERESALARGPDLAGMDADELDLLNRLDIVEPTHIDDLARAVTFGIARLQTGLLRLELRQAVETLPGGYYLSRRPLTPAPPE